jgi:hypothetical protein
MCMYDLPWNKISHVHLQWVNKPKAKYVYRFRAGDIFYTYERILPLHNLHFQKIQAYHCTRFRTRY